MTTAETEILKRSSNTDTIEKVGYTGSSSISNFMIRAVRNRIPRFTSTGGSDPYLADHNSHSRSQSSGSWSTLVGTPSPVYRSNTSLCTSEDELDSSDDQRVSSYAPSNQEIVSANFMLNSFTETAETECGIKWKFANQGILPVHFN
jgi:hypothetical protein